MKDLTTHRFFVPIATVASVVISAISMTWYIAGLFSKIDVRLAVMETLLSQHLKTNPTALIWTKGDMP